MFSTDPPRTCRASGVNRCVLARFPLGHGLLHGSGCASVVVCSGRCNMDGTSREACPHWVRIPGLKNVNGADVDLELKAWLHADDSMWWELRRVYDGLNLVS
eukprot:2519121-Amphidinium_carterae.1